jgi:hypothetical protein
MRCQCRVNPASVYTSAWLIAAMHCPHRDSPLRPQAAQPPHLRYAAQPGQNAAVSRLPRCQNDCNLLAFRSRKGVTR